MEDIIIDIQIKKHSKIKDFFHKLHSKSEDLFFTIIQHIPEKFIPHQLMKKFNSYLDKRLQQLKQQSVKSTWERMYLEDVVKEIRSNNQIRQDKK